MSDIEIIAPTGAVDVTVGGVAQVGPSGGGGGGGGAVLRYGTGAPSNGLGIDGDFYIATDTDFIYGPKAAGTWPAGTSIVGSAGADGLPGTAGLPGSDGSDGAPGADGSDGAPGADGSDGAPGTDGSDGADGLPGADGSDGAPGAAGADGADGSTVLNGSGAPTGGTGDDGDFYIDTTANSIYGPKTVGAWGSGTDLVGAAGTSGADGADGADGASGSAGLSVLNGAGAPGGGTGVDGEFYIDTTANAIYGPKTGGAWGSLTSLVGPSGATGAAGAAGSPGADGFSVLNGTIDPTTEGTNGDFYINTTTWDIFGPKASGSWPAGSSLVGAAGGADITSDTKPTAADNTVKAYRYDLAGDHDSPAWLNGDGALIVPERSEIFTRKSALRPRVYGGVDVQGFLKPAQWGTKTEPNQALSAFDAVGFDNHGRVEIANSGGNNTVGDYYQASNSGGVYISKGFVYSLIFANLTGMADAEARAFVGISSNIGGPHSGGTEPGANHASWVNFVGLTKQSGDTNWQLRHKSAIQGVATAIDLGVNFPANTNDTDMYRLTLVGKSGETAIHYRVDRLNTGHSSVGKITADLPDDETYLAHHFWYSTGNPGAALAGCIFGVYGEQAWFGGDV